MRRYLRTALLSVLCLAFFSGTLLAQEKVITWATNPQYPPYDWATDDKGYAGACVELLSLITPKGYVFKPVVVPWSRAQEMAKRGEIDMLINLRITPERSEWLEFSINPTFINPIAVFVRKDKTIPFKSWDELKPLRGGVTLGDAFGNGFDEYLKANLTVDVISNMSGNFLKLNSGRIDYFVSGYYMGEAWLAQAGFQDRIVALSPPISNTSIHLGFSKLSRYLETLPEIDQHLSRLRADGTLDRMLAAHSKAFSSHPVHVFAE